jgi:hypothetical protein
MPLRSLKLPGLVRNVYDRIEDRAMDAARQTEAA